MFREVDPFHHPKSLKISGVLIFQFIIGFLKLPFFILLFTFAFIQFIIASMIPINFVSYVITRFYSVTCINLLLYLLGENKVSVVPTALCENYFEVEDKPKPKPGDIIISNSISYLSLFWFQKEYSPLFVIPLSNTGIVVTHSFFTLFTYILSDKSPQSGNQTTITKAIQKAKTMNVPIVIFPESVPTNGKCLIKFFDFCGKSDLSNITFHIFGVSSRKCRISPFLGDMNPSLHFLLMLGKFSTTLKFYTALPQDIPQYSENFVSDCRGLLGTILRIPLVNVSSAEQKKKRFLANNMKNK